MFEQINFLAVILCAALNMALGMFWYGFLFTKPWMRLSGIQKKHLENKANAQRARLGYALSTFCSLIMALALALVIKVTGLQSLGGGFILGFACWLGFSFTSMLPNHLFALKPIGLAAIDMGYPLISLCVMGSILGAWS